MVSWGEMILTNSVSGAVRAGRGSLASWKGFSHDNGELLTSSSFSSFLKLSDWNSEGISVGHSTQMNVQ